MMQAYEPKCGYKHGNVFRPFAYMMKTNGGRWYRRQDVEAELRWIPVSDRLPEQDMCVLVNANGAVNCMAYVVDRGWEDWTSPENPNVHPELITHWLPIPTPPENEQ